MATLTETAYYTRRIINWSIVALIAYIILRFIFGVVMTTIVALLPPKPPKANNAFGPLMSIQYPLEASGSSDIQYRLGTIDGTVPEASGTAKVYFMPKEKPNLLGLSTIKALAAQFKFTAEPVEKEKTIYEWIDTADPLRTLVINSVSKHLELSYDFGNDLTLFAEKNFPSKDKIVSDAMKLLQKNNLFPADISPFTAKVVYLKLIGGNLVPTTSTSDADAVKIDFFRNPVDAMRVVTADPTTGIISLTFSGSSDTQKRLIGLSWRYWPVTYSLSGRYKLINAGTAWNTLLAGSGFVAANPQKATNVTIRNMYLAYYDSYDSQLFLQPIFVFEGEGGFIGYVSAVKY